MPQIEKGAEPPTISIITVVKNGANTITGCIHSVQNQQWPVEHVFVDGASTDGTVDLIRAHADSDAKIVSEPDDGLYDAMNKGLALATGEVIGILNADDEYADNDVLSTVARAFGNPKVEACYGDLVYVDPERTDKVTRYWKSDAVSERLLYRGWMPPHPTFFVRRSVYECHGVFRTDLGTAADYELTLRFLLKHGIRADYIPRVLVTMRSGGASNASMLNRLKVNLFSIKKAWDINDLQPPRWILWARLLSTVSQYYAGKKALKR